MSSQKMVRDSAGVEGVLVFDGQSGEGVTVELVGGKRIALHSSQLFSQTDGSYRYEGRFQDAGSSAVGVTTAAQSGAAAIPVIQEELQVGKREVQSGGVRVETHVTEQAVEKDVNLREEHVSVSRRPVDRAATDADFAPLAGGAIEVTAMAEEVVVAKNARVVEEVLVSKDVSQRTEHISDTVRRTDVEIIQLGDTFRKDFGTRYGGKNFQYEQVEPAYQYGYEFGTNPSYSGKDWTAVEPAAKSAWSTQHSDRRWEDYGDAIRYGYEQNKSRKV